MNQLLVQNPQSQNVQGLKHYSLPENFNLNKVDGDTSSINKSEAISQRVSQIFSENAGLIATIAFLSSPLFPITWSIGYAIIRQCYAKQDVKEAIAQARLDLLSENGAIGKKVTQVKTSGQELPKNSVDAIRIFDFGLSQTVFSKYFKKTHLEMIATGSCPKINEEKSNIENWTSFKTNTQEDRDKIRALKSVIKKKYHMTPEELDACIYKTIAFGQNESDGTNLLLRKSVMKTLSTPELLLPLLQNFIKDQNEFLSITAAMKSDKSKRDAMIQGIQEAIEMGLKGDLEELKNKPHVRITEENLPVMPTLSRDAKGGLPAYTIGKEKHRTSSTFKAFITDDSSSIVLICHDANKTAYKKLIMDVALSPLVKLYKKMTDNKDFSKENKEKLWAILQLARTQTFLGSLNHTFTDLILAGKFSPTGEEKQNIHIKYDYDETKNSLDITFQRRFIFQNKIQVPIRSHLFSEVKMTIDLASEDLARSYTMLSLGTLPVTQRTFFDELPEGGVLSSIPEPDGEVVTRLSNIVVDLEDMTSSDEEKNSTEKGESI